MQLGSTWSSSDIRSLASILTCPPDVSSKSSGRALSVPSQPAPGRLSWHLGSLTQPSKIPVQHKSNETRMREQLLSLRAAQNDLTLGTRRCHGRLAVGDFDAKRLLAKVANRAESVFCSKHIP